MFKTLADYKDNKDNSNEEKKEQNAYTGGTSSGMAVQNPSDTDKLV